MSFELSLEKCDFTSGRDFFFLLKTHHACKVSQDVKLSVTVSRLFIIFFRGTRDLLEVSVPKAHR